MNSEPLETLLHPACSYRCLKPDTRSVDQDREAMRVFERPRTDFADRANLRERHAPVRILRPEECDTLLVHDNRRGVTDAHGLDCTCRETRPKRIPLSS